VGIRGWLQGRWGEAAAWAEGRAWLPRALLLAALAYLGWRHLTDAEYGGIFGGLTLGVHELGHLLFSPFGEWLATAGGSLTQVAAPVALAYGFLRQRDYYAIAVAGAWEGMSLSNLATYIGDARAEELSLVSPFSGDPQHDWSYLLGSAGLLPQDHLIAAAVRLLAFLTLAASLGFGARLCVVMARRGPPRSTPSTRPPLPRP
jgi:hypothetical protein